MFTKTYSTMPAHFGTDESTLLMSGWGSRLIKRLGPLPATLPGLALTAAVATVATVLGHLVPIIGGAVLAILLGISIRLLTGLSRTYVPGVRIAGKQLLQWGIVMLGAGLSLRQVWTTGLHSLVVLLGTLLIGLPIMLTLGRLLRVERTLTRLISVGTGICGASAIGALAPILEADEATISYAVTTVFLFNIAAVLLFPPLGHLLGLSQQGFGLWAGTAVNDTSSVVATGYSFGVAAGTTAVIVKLTRTTLIVPVSLLFAALAARERRVQAAPTARPARVGVPIFILCFLGAGALNTLGLLGAGGPHVLTTIGQFLIVTALAGIGLSADLRAMARTGGRPVLLGLLGWMCLAAVSLMLQRLTGLI
jgi:uncharacterized integral membrane protein (TIGR00698 family)